MTTTRTLTDRDHVAEAVRLIVGEDAVTELRALNATMQGERYPTTLAGYFNDPDKLADAVMQIRTAMGIYVTPNPVNPALLARAANRIRRAPKGESTADSDIIARRHLLIDADAVRPSGISASDAEHDAALARCGDIGLYLHEELGWPGPIEADSGNGGHLLYRIDLPTDDDGLVRRCLAALAQRFNDGIVKIDQSVFNPARICKLYGTWACKGDNTADRPHRMARILDYPSDGLAAVTREQLEALAAEVKVETPARDRIVKPKPARGHRFARFDSTPAGVRGYLESHGVNIISEHRNGRGVWLLLDRCPVTGVEAHGSDIGVVVDDDGIIGYRNQHDRGAGVNWLDVREALEPGYHEHVERATTKPDGKPRNKRTDDPPSRVLYHRLGDIECTPIDWLWKYRFAVGFNMIAGMPDVGKGVLFCDLAARVSTGMGWPPVNGEQDECKQGSVIILTSEEGLKDTLAPRLNAAGADRRKVAVIDAILDRDENGDEVRRGFEVQRDVRYLDQIADELGDVRMVIIDPLEGVLGFKVDSNAGPKMRAATWAIRDFAERRNVAIVWIHHFSKGDTTNALDKVSGSRSIAAQQRMLWVVGRHPDDNDLRVMTCAKANNVADKNKVALTYEIRSACHNEEIPIVAWTGETTDVTASEIIGGKRTMKEKAATWLGNLLRSYGGQLPATEVEEHAAQNGFNMSTLGRAKEVAGVESVQQKDERGKVTGWVWRFIEPDP